MPKWKSSCWRSSEKAFIRRQRSGNALVADPLEQIHWIKRSFNKHEDPSMQVAYEFTEVSNGNLGLTVSLKNLKNRRKIKAWDRATK